MAAIDHSPGRPIRWVNCDKSRGDDCDIYHTFSRVALGIISQQVSNLYGDLVGSLDTKNSLLTKRMEVSFTTFLLLLYACIKTRFVTCFLRHSLSLLFIHMHRNPIHIRCIDVSICMLTAMNYSSDWVFLRYNIGSSV